MKGKNTVCSNRHHEFTLLPYTYSSVCINLFDENIYLQWQNQIAK